MNIEYKLLKKLREDLNEKKDTRSSLRILNKKLDKAAELFNLIKYKRDNSEQHALLLEKATLIYTDIEDIVRERSKLNLTSFKSAVTAIIFTHRLSNWAKMANALDIKTASQLSQLIPAYDGKTSETNSFVDALNLVKSIITANQTDTVITLVLTKMTGKARDLFTERPATFNEIIEKIKLHCREKTSSDSVSARLTAKARKGQDVLSYTKEVEQLCTTLEKAYIREEVTGTVAKRMAQKQAIQNLIKNCQKVETRMMLKIGKFANLDEAINLLIEDEQTATDQSTAVLQINRSSRGNFQNQRGRQRGNGRNFRGRNHQTSYRPNYNYSYGNNRSYYRGNSRGNNRGNSQNNYSRVFYNSVQAEQMPQEMENSQNNVGFQQTLPQQQQNQMLLTPAQQSQVALAQLIPQQ